MAENAATHRLLWDHDSRRTTVAEGTTLRFFERLRADIKLVPEMPSN